MVAGSHSLALHLPKCITFILGEMVRVWILPPFLQIDNCVWQPIKNPNVQLTLSWRLKAALSSYLSMVLLFLSRALLLSQEAFKQKPSKAQGRAECDKEKGVSECPKILQPTTPTKPRGMKRISWELWKHTQEFHHSKKHFKVWDYIKFQCPEIQIENINIS